MAGARAAVERRKASALRSARAASDDAAQGLRLSALCLPLFFWRPTRGTGFTQNSDADASRERRHFPPPRSGGGGPLELAQRANRGGGGAGRGASLAAQKILVARRSERANMSEGHRNSRAALSPAPPPPPCFAGTADASRRRYLRKVRRPEAAYAPSPAIAGADKKLPRPRLEHRLDRDMRPGGNLVAEGHVGIMHLAGLVALGRELAEHIAGRRARRGDEIGRKGAQLRVVARGQRRQ